MRITATVTALLCAANMYAQIPESPHFTLQRLAHGVYAAVATDTGYAICNAGIVDMGDAVLVFDAFISPRAAADLRRAAIAISGKPVTYVVNSHYHNDHIRGNQEFPEAHIISTVWTRKAIAENEPEEIRWEKENVRTRLATAQKALTDGGDHVGRAEAKFWAKYYESILDAQDSLRTVLPDVTFEGKFVLHGPVRSVELIEMSGGHTRSDLILYLPVEGILFTGDLLFINRHPYLPDGFPDDWLRALERMSALDVRAIVPGHGPVGTQPDLGKMAGYIKAVQNVAAELVKQEATEQDIEAQAVPAPFQSWWYSRFFRANLKHVVALAKEQQSKRNTPPVK